MGIRLPFYSQLVTKISKFRGKYILPELFLITGSLQVLHIPQQHSGQVMCKKLQWLYHWSLDQRELNKTFIGFEVWWKNCEWNGLLSCLTLLLWIVSIVTWWGWGSRLIRYDTLHFAGSQRHVIQKHLSQNPTMWEDELVVICSCCVYSAQIKILHMQQQQCCCCMCNIFVFDITQKYFCEMWRMFVKQSPEKGCHGYHGVEY